MSDGGLLCVFMLATLYFQNFIREEDANRSLSSEALKYSSDNTKIAVSGAALIR